MINISKNIKILAVIPILAIGFNGQITKTANAQSFPCERAQIPSELAVCNNENLLVLDEQVANLFADIRVSAVGQADIRKVTSGHSEWLRRRNECETDFGCLEQHYQKRIYILDTQLGLNDGKLMIGY